MSLWGPFWHLRLDFYMKENFNFSLFIVHCCFAFPYLKPKFSYLTSGSMVCIEVTSVGQKKADRAKFVSKLFAKLVITFSAIGPHPSKTPNGLDAGVWAPVCLCTLGLYTTFMCTCVHTNMHAYCKYVCQCLSVCICVHRSPESVCVQNYTERLCSHPGQTS